MYDVYVCTIKEMRQRASTNNFLLDLSDLRKCRLSFWFAQFQFSNFQMFDGKPLVSKYPNKIN